MEQKKKISLDSLVCDGLPSYKSAKFPWLVAEDDVANQIFYDLVHDPQSGSKYESCGIPELLGKRIRGCFHGWLILSSNHPHTGFWFIWKPVTSKIINLPPLNRDPASIGECCLSSPPDDDAGSILLLTRTDKSTFVFCRLDLKRKRLRWVEMSYAKELKRVTFDGDLVHSLTCCNGKVYALSTDGPFAQLVLQVDIEVKDKEVVIKLVLLGACPFEPSNRCSDWIYFLKGSRTELFLVSVGFHEETKRTPGAVYLFRSDMTSVKWEEIEDLKRWDTSGIIMLELQSEDLEGLNMSRDMWEEIQDLKDAIFCVDLARDCPIFYNHAAAIASSSEFGQAGYIHIYGKTGKIIYSYHVKDNTVSISSRVLLQRLEEDDHGEAAKCTVDSKQEVEDEMIAVRPITDDEVNINESHLLNIPSHVLSLIMEFCAGVEYMNFRATCKNCHLAAPLIQWRRNNETTLRRLQTYSLVSPWLMVVDKNQGTITFTDPMLGDNYFMKNSHVSFFDDNDRIFCSRFGWLLFDSIDFECLVFFNPFTSDLRKLPEPDFNLESLCFSAPPTSRDCMVVGFTSQDQWFVHIHFVAWEPTWRSFILGPDPHSVCVPTFYGRDLYALNKEGKVIVFKDLGHEDYYSWKFFEAEAPAKSSSRFYLTKCDQHLLLVILREFGEVVEVFKWNDLIKGWHKIDDLGTHMIYICGTTCVCIEAKVPHMENKIYFPWLHSKNKKIVFYSLETCACHTFNDKIIQEDFTDLLGTTHHLSPHAWIEPSWL